MFNVADESAEGVFQANAVTNYESHVRKEDPSEKHTLIAFTTDSMVYAEHGARRMSAIPPSLIVLGTT
jgi:hypothetical protein